MTEFGQIIAVAGIQLLFCRARIGTCQGLQSLLFHPYPLRQGDSGK